MKKSKDKLYSLQIKLEKVTNSNITENESLNISTKIAQQLTTFYNMYIQTMNKIIELNSITIDSLDIDQSRSIIAQQTEFNMNNKTLIAFKTYQESTKRMEILQHNIQIMELWKVLSITEAQFHELSQAIPCLNQLKSVKDMTWQHIQQALESPDIFNSWLSKTTIVNRYIIIKTETDALLQTRIDATSLGLPIALTPVIYKFNVGIIENLELFVKKLENFIVQCGSNASNELLALNKTITSLTQNFINHNKLCDTLVALHEIFSRNKTTELLDRVKVGKIVEFLNATAVNIQGNSLTFKQLLDCEWSHTINGHFEYMEGVFQCVQIKMNEAYNICPKLKVLSHTQLINLLTVNCTLDGEVFGDIVDALRLINTGWDGIHINRETVEITHIVGVSENLLLIKPVKFQTLFLSWFPILENEVKETLVAYSKATMEYVNNVYTGYKRFDAFELMESPLQVGIVSLLYMRTKVCEGYIAAIGGATQRNDVTANNSMHNGNFFNGSTSHQTSLANIQSESDYSTVKKNKKKSKNKEVDDTKKENSGVFTSKNQDAYQSRLTLPNINKVNAIQPRIKSKNISAIATYNRADKRSILIDMRDALLSTLNHKYHTLSYLDRLKLQVLLSTQYSLCEEAKNDLSGLFSIKDPLWCKRLRAYGENGNFIIEMAHYSALSQYEFIGNIKITMLSPDLMNYLMQLSTTLFGEVNASLFVGNSVQWVNTIEFWCALLGTPLHKYHITPSNETMIMKEMAKFSNTSHWLLIANIADASTDFQSEFCKMIKLNNGENLNLYKPHYICNTSTEDSLYPQISKAFRSIYINPPNIYASSKAILFTVGFTLYQVLARKIEILCNNCKIDANIILKYLPYYLDKIPHKNRQIHTEESYLYDILRTHIYPLLSKYSLNLALNTFSTIFSTNTNIVILPEDNLISRIPWFSLNQYPSITKQLIKLRDYMRRPNFNYKLIIIHGARLSSKSLFISLLNSLHAPNTELIFYPTRLEFVNTELLLKKINTNKDSWIVLSGSLSTETMSKANLLASQLKPNIKIFIETSSDLHTLSLNPVESYVLSTSTLDLSDIWSFVLNKYKHESKYPSYFDTLHKLLVLHLASILLLNQEPNSCQEETTYSNLEHFVLNGQFVV